VGCGLQNPAVTGPRAFVPDTTNNKHKKRTLLLLLIASEVNTIACCGNNLTLNLLAPTTVDARFNP